MILIRQPSHHLKRRRKQTRLQNAHQIFVVFHFASINSARSLLELTVY